MYLPRPWSTFFVELCVCVCVGVAGLRDICGLLGVQG